MEPRNRIFTSIAILIMMVFVIYIIANRDNVFTPLNEKTSQEDQKTGLNGDSRTYLEIVNDVVTGKSDEVPTRFKKTKELIILEYLHGCYNLTNAQMKIDCYEFYYLNNFNEMKNQKESCRNSGNEVPCLDGYYAEMSQKFGIFFCEPINDELLKNRCKSSVAH